MLFIFLDMIVVPWSEIILGLLGIFLLSLLLIAFLVFIGYLIWKALHEKKED